MGHEDDTRLSEELRLLKEGLIKKDKEIEGLKISNLFLGTLFDGISEEIMVLDPDFNVTDVNRAFLKRYGFKKSDVLGQKCYEIKKRSKAPCNFEAISCPLTLAKKAGHRVEMSLFHEDAKGEKKELALYMYPIKLRGKSIKYFLEIARDVTENRA
ncbi:MAG: PAS domain-containing protein, partial [Desulfatiglandales bacterium]